MQVEGDSRVIMLEIKIIDSKYTYRQYIHVHIETKTNLLIFFYMCELYVNLYMYLI